MSELLVEPTAPCVLRHANGRLEREVEELREEMPWDESLIRAGLFLFLSLLPQDPSLLHQLASVYARSGTEIKRVLFFILSTNFVQNKGHIPKHRTGNQINWNALGVFAGND